MFAIDKKHLQQGGAVACAVLAGILVWFFLRHAEQSYQDAGETVAVLTSRRYITPGSPLRRAFFRTVRIPKAYVAPGAVTSFDVLESSDRARFRTSLPLPEGLQLTERDLTPLTQEDALSQLIGDHQVAVSFGVDSVHGLGGNLQPGDLIDVIHSSKPTELTTSPPQTSILFQSVPLIAVGKKWIPLNRLHEPVQEKEERPEKDDADITVLTVLLNPIAALRLAQARDSGILSVILRAPGDSQTWSIPP